MPEQQQQPTPVEQETLYIEDMAREAGDMGRGMFVLVSAVCLVARQLERIADAQEGRHG